jgi:phage anti-repressor protein
MDQKWRRVQSVRTLQSALLRIAKYGFVESQDYVTESRSPNPASGNRGASTEYHASLDMAKELAMVENNDKGRDIRRDFIAVEKRIRNESRQITGPQFVQIVELTGDPSCSYYVLMPANEEPRTLRLLDLSPHDTIVVRCECGPDRRVSWCLAPASSGAIHNARL